MANRRVPHRSPRQPIQCLVCTSPYQLQLDTLTSLHNPGENVGKDQLTELIVAKLEETAEKIKAEWLRPIGTTTRHFIVDDLLPESVAHAIYDAFPRDGSGFFSRESFREKKRTSANLDQYAPILADITYA